MTELDRLFISECIGQMVRTLMRRTLAQTPGEIYDAIAQELERRCRAVIDAQSQQQLGSAEQELGSLRNKGQGFFNKGDA